MNRRLHFLEQKKYVRKLGSTYKVGLKGTVLLLVVAPDILKQFPESFWQDDDPDVKFQEPEYWPKNAKTFREPRLAMFSSNTVASEIFAFAARKTMLALKINLDDIEPQELSDLLNDVLTKAYQKNKGKFRRILE